MKNYISFTVYYILLLTVISFCSSDDSVPGAICLPDIKFGSSNKTLFSEENQTMMKRYLQCPGMCRIEVLKKFVRNKYNVDTTLFFVS